MPTWLRWMIAVLLLLVLIAIFVITFILYKKTPVPKGCEEFEKPSEQKCHGCHETSCHFNLYYNDPEEQAKEQYLKEKADAEKLNAEKKEEEKK